MHELKLYLLGPPRLEQNNVPLPLNRRKAMALLVYLAVTREIQSREVLATLLWPDYEPYRGRANLRRELTALRKALGERWLTVNREQVGLDWHDSDQVVWLDVVQFQQLLATCRSHDHAASEFCPSCLSAMSEAVELYRGDFLAGFSISGSREFDEWQFFQAESLRRELAGAFEWLVNSYTLRSEFDAAIFYARHWLALDSLHEPAHRHLMRLYAWAGQQAAALRQYQACARLFAEELGTGPEEETDQLYEAIKARRLSRPPAARREYQAELPPSLASTATKGQASHPHPATQPHPPPSSLEQTRTRDEVERVVFVAREHELAQLDTFLEAALAGQSQVLFLSGEAGSGKTAMMYEFARRNQEKQRDLIVAIGNCNAYGGVGDPYLPFREILGLVIGNLEAGQAGEVLTRENTARLESLSSFAVPLLLALGPDLVGSFVPGTAPVSNEAPSADNQQEQLPKLAARQTMARKRDPTPAPGSTGLERSRIFEQYADVLQAIAAQYPLILILDDLQWIDLSSIGLLFHLGQRVKQSRILIVGAYRPEEVAQGWAGQQHPLESVLGEFKRRFGNTTIDLDQIGQARGPHFVEALLDSEPNRLGEKFRQELAWRTGGHPLFTIELLRDMQERGYLVRDAAGRLVEGQNLVWRGLPARVEGAIEQRIGRLEAGLRRALTVACVEGEEFTAEVIARVLGVEAQKLIRQLSNELGKQHRLVRSQGSQWSGGQRASHYRFRHILFQRYLYNTLDEVERVYLHEAVGKVLEQLHGQQTQAIAVQLARHFHAADIREKAIVYLRQAGERAVRLSANEEAMAHFTQALALVNSLPDPAERVRQELPLQIALGNSLVATQGYAAPDVEKTYRRAWELCQHESVENSQQFLPVLYGLWSFNFARAEHQTAHELAGQLFQLAQQQQDTVSLIEAHRTLGLSLFYMGKPTLAQDHFKQILGLYDPLKHRSLAFRYGQQDPQVAALTYTALTLWLLGYPEQAVETSQQALAAARKLSHSHNLAYALSFAAMLDQFRRAGQAAQEKAEEAITISAAQGFPVWKVLGTLLRGWALAGQGQGEEGMTQLQQGLADLESIEIKVQWPYFLALVAEAYGIVGQVEKGLRILSEGIATLDRSGESFWKAEMVRLKGELLLKKDEGGKVGNRGLQDEESPDAYFLRAVEIARDQHARSLALRATVNLSQLWLRQGKQEKAGKMLAEIYGWFTEGYDTADLKEARRLLEMLSFSKSKT